MCVRYLEGGRQDGALQATPSSYSLVKIKSCVDLTFEHICNDLFHHGNTTATAHHLNRVQVSQSESCTKESNINN